jgi:membrane-associated protease RseP (regulator of RpoE activity)
MTPVNRGFQNRARKQAALAAAVCLTALPLFGSDSKSEAARLLSEVKAATGGTKWDRIRTWHEKGTFQAGDLKGTHEAWLDFPRLRSFTDDRGASAILGTIRDANGWNGKVAWSADQTGDVYIADSEEARSAAIGTAYVAAFAYLFFNKRHAAIEAKAPQTAAGTQFDVVLVSPRGTDPFELWIDRASHRVQRVVQIAGVDKITSLFSDFREVAGVAVPFRMIQSGAKAAGPPQSWQLASVEINTVEPAGVFDPPAAKFTDVHFPDGQDSVTFDFRYDGDEIYLPVSLNGQSQDKFVFDIGSTNSIATKKAAAMGLKSEIVGTEYGGGTGSAVQGLVKVARLQIGGLVFDNQVLDTMEIGSGDEDPEGMIGYEVAKRTVVVIDYEKHHITFMKPEAFHAPAHAVGVPFRFASRTDVLISATVDGIRGEFGIDTGAANSLMINRPFAERHDFIARHHAVHESTVSGIGGEAKTLLFRPSQFAIASLRPPAPVGQIYLAESGGGAVEHVAGNIGNGILKRFTLTLDYAHRMLYFEPNAHFNEPDVSSAGWFGMTVNRNGISGPIDIVEVEPASPAALGGILKGDRIVAINNSPLDKYTNEQLGIILNAVPGTTLQFTIQRGSESRELELTSKPLI